MRFKRLKLVGFKSFVDPAELRIEPGLTGIVGPNGCGKSNLLEALRWVMGEGSARSLRGGGMDDVIFAGTASRPSRDFAEVQLFADRRAGESGGPAAIAEDGELEVVRRIERGAGSVYRVNGRDVRAKDVGLIFADAATGAHSPALVSQGRIGAVIAARPAERRAMLEEAAGIAGLYVRRKDAEQKLRATEANLERLGELIGDMEGRQGALRRQARQAERYRVLSTAIKVAEARLIFVRWREASAAADAAKADAAAREARAAEVAEAQRAAAAWNGEAARLVAAARVAALAAREEASAIGHRQATLKAELAATERRIAEIEAARERLAVDRAREGVLANDAAEAIARLGEEAAALEAAIAEAEASRPELVEALATAESAVRDAEVALAQALARQAREQAEAQVAHSALSAASGRADRAAREVDRINAEAGALGDDAALAETRDDAAALRIEAEAAARAAEAEIAEAEQARADSAAARDAAELVLAEASAELAAARGEQAALERTLASRAVGAQLIDRIRPDPGYEHAVAAALGDGLEAVVGLAGWAGAEGMPDDPKLPEGAVALARHAEAPPELMRRLALTGVVEADDGEPLPAGVQIVTRAGRTRRWDGFVAAEGSAAAAERLVRANRLDALAPIVAALAGSVDAARQKSETAARILAKVRTESEAARAALASAESIARAARRDEEAAAIAIERLSARRGEIDARRVRAADERDEAAADRDRAAAAVEVLPDGVAVGRQVAALAEAASAARGLVADRREASAALDRSIAGNRERRGIALAEIKAWRSRAGEAARRIEEMTRRAAAAEADAVDLGEAPARLALAIAALEDEQVAGRARNEAAAEAERDAEARLRDGEATLAAAGEALAQAREARAGAIARAEAQDLRRVEMGRVSGERFECPPSLLPERLGFLAESIGEVAAESARLERLTLERERIGPVNLVAERELAELEATLAQSTAERDELAQAVNRLRGSIGSLNREGRARLLAAFEAVDRHFRRLFTTLFDGGEAYLQLIDSDDPLEAGLEIMAQPPGKKLTALTLLSGGEQALTAVALIFALFLTNPAPICVLDEVDAPLDDANIERFCDLLDAMVSETETRYLIVTHNAVTMSRMHRLFGVTMIERGVSRLVSVDLGAAEQLLAAE